MNGLDTAFKYDLSVRIVAWNGKRWVRVATLLNVARGADRWDAAQATGNAHAARWAHNHGYAAQDVQAIVTVAYGWHRDGSTW